MSLDSILTLLQTALELGLISSLTVLALFLSYSMLNVCDLSTDGCFTLGATVGAAVAIAGHPYLAIPAAMLAGVTSGFVTAFLQTKMGVNSLLAGIIVNTALYSVNIAVMGGASVLNMNKTQTVFTKMRALLGESALAGQYKLIVALLAVALAAVLLGLFLKTRLGLAIRATGMVTIALASLLIGQVFLGRRRIPLRIFGMVLGAFAFRLVYTVALRFEMPAFMLKLVSAVVVVAAISIPYLKQQYPLFRRRAEHRKERGRAGC